MSVRIVECGKLEEACGYKTVWSDPGIIFFLSFACHILFHADALILLVRSISAVEFVASERKKIFPRIR